MRYFLAAMALLALVIYASPSPAAPQKPIEHLKLNSTEWWCDSIDNFQKWIEASNKYGPIVLEVPSTYGCHTKRIMLRETKPLFIMKAFNVPMLAVEAEAFNEGRVYTFVPILPSLPFKSGNGA